jgi:hypothetical protein
MNTILLPQEHQATDADVVKSFLELITILLTYHIYATNIMYTLKRYNPHKIMLLIYAYISNYMFFHIYLGNIYRLKKSKAIPVTGLGGL